MAASKNQITQSSTAEYFSKNLQQVGFSSPTKAVLTTLKEALDNALDACEEEGILPEVEVVVEKKGAGTLKNSERVLVRVTDNGPGIGADDVPKVFGEYLASSKFGRGRCSRGQQGIGISAATTWAQLTNATGVRVITKTKAMRKALSCTVEVDIKKNQGVIKNKDTIEWDRPHGTMVEFVIDGRIQLNGEAGLLNYLNSNVLVNPHMTLTYTLPVSDPEAKPEAVRVERVTTNVPRVPEATEPHPHTMKLGEFIAHSHLFGKMAVKSWLKKGFSRISDQVLDDLVHPKSPARGDVPVKKAKEGDDTEPETDAKTGQTKLALPEKRKPLKKSLLEKSLDQMSDEEFRELYTAIQAVEMRPPSTNSVMAIGEESLGSSIKRLGEIDFFSVNSRRPTICDFKPVQVEVAIARLLNKSAEFDEPVQVLRFANRVPLQFDKAACAIVKAITSVNWKSYGMAQPKNALPLGPYIIAVSIVSPFIKFKNASKETIDASDELVEEIRRALMQGGQKLSRHIRREFKADALEQKIRHIEQFGPILVDGLCRITKAPETRKKKAEQGLLKLLGRDARDAEQELKEADQKLEAHKASEA